MVKNIRKMLSICLVLVMLLNMLPLNAFAADTSKQTSEENKVQESIAEDVHVVEEIIEKRTEYTKQFRLSNGLNIATVYASPVHYNVDGQWEEIDNTLQMSSTRSGKMYVNTAGIWQVSFPQSMTEDNGVTIAKDGYVFNFRMAGELLDPNIKDIIVDSEIIEIPAATEEPTAGEEETVPAVEETFPTEESTEVPEETVISEETEAMESAEVQKENVTEPTAAEGETAASETEASETAAEAEQEVTEEDAVISDELEASSPSDNELAESTDVQGGIILEIVEPEAEVLVSEPDAEELSIVSAPKDNATAEIESVDMEEIKAQAEYPETIIEKNSSRLSYDGIFEDTDIIFDLNSNQLKESVVLNAYREDLKGYIYALEVGDLTPVLLEGGEIELRDADGKEVIMYMPAPYLIDAAGATCLDVNVSLEGENGKYVLAYELPLEWLADSGRQWPVILDPAVRPSLSVSNIRDITLFENAAAHNGIWYLQCGNVTNSGTGHVYLKYTNIPKLSNADVIISANVIMYTSDRCTSTPQVVEVHKVEDEWLSETITWANKPDYVDTVEDYQICSGTRTGFSWDITDLVRGWYDNENTGMMFKLTKEAEASTGENYIDFYASDHATGYEPTVVILYRNNNGLESYWDYTTSSAGRAGTGYVNQYTGNLVWIRDDIGFGGNRMPVNISHIYNSNDSTENLFGMGYGWRTNFNQRVYKWNSGNAYGDYYVWEDSDGTDHYFLKESTDTYKDEDGLELTLTINGSGNKKYCITDKYGNKSYFDYLGRLTKQENNQTTSSSIDITYTDGGLISSITDGANRVYTFSYWNNLLNKITYKGKGTSEISSVSFSYENSRLTKITDKDGKESIYTYVTNTSSNVHNLLLSAQDIDGYKIRYEYTSTTAGNPSRISKIGESDDGKIGGELTLEYAHNQTKFTDHNGNIQIVQFNNMGNTVSVQDDQGRAQYAQYAINDPTNPDDATTAAARTGNTAKGNQLLMASKLQNTVGNVLDDSSFENGTLWGRSHAARVSRQISTTESFLGNKSLAMTHTGDGVESCLISPSFTVGPGETYTFSAYVKCGEGDAYLCMSDGSVWPKSAVLSSGSEWTRLEVSYTNTGSAAKDVTARFQTSLPGTSYIDCVQVEKAPTASRYNLIQNGDFRTTASWNPVSGRTTTGTENIEKVPASQLDTNVYKMTGNPQGTNRISQTVAVSGDEGDTFVLAGWAKADSVQLIDNRKFSLIATFKNGNATVNTTTVNFNPCADSTISWQYAASPIIAGGAYTSIVVEVAYDYNANTAYFDGIQLYKEEFGNSYTYDEKGNIISVKDLQSQNTTYKFDANDNLVEEILPSGAKLTYKYDTHHNVTKATSSTGVVYDFTYDAYGNNTSVSITSGTQSISSSAQYTDDKNRLYSTTDATGNTTLYDYDENTNVLKSVQYPQDTADSKTTYTYDNMYRLASAAANVKIGTSSAGTLSAEYEYENDLLKSITTGSTEYSFNYTDFALRSNIKIGSRTLASYIYKGINDTNAGLTGSKFADAPIHSLLGLDYGNGDKVQYTYDKQGRITTQEYRNENNAVTGTVAYSYDNNGNLAKTTNSATNGWDNYYYDFTDRLVKTSSKHYGYAYSVEYGYNSDNNLATLREGFPGYTRETSYTYDKDNRITKMYVYGDSTYYAYDSYGRVSTRTTKGHSPTLTETYTYRTVNSKQTGQVSNLAVTATGYSNSFGYTYDANGNILTVSNGGKTTKYTYDSANQLVREDNQKADKTWTWSYDDAGNITSRKEYAYTTGTLGSVQSTVNYTYDGTWGDLLTGYAGKVIQSDTIGNMTSDGTWTYTWENGRQLASMTSGGTTWNYKYNTDGLRVQRQQGSATYKYFYTGGKLTQMSTPTSILRFTYDSSGKPLTIVVDGTPYYYVTNLQGDVVAILSRTGEKIAEYEYDAWGKLISQEPAANSIGNMNPLRYRGYIYDVETTLYYLQSRYYNPAMGRFINGDDVANLGADEGLTSFNLFAYCSNNPVNRFDDNGNWSLPNWAKVVIGVGVIAAAAAVTVATGGAAAGTLAFAVHCAAQGALVGAATQGALGAVTGGISGAVMHRMTTGSWSGATNAAIDGAATGFMTGAVTGAITGALSSPQCFVAGTTVLTATGAVAIEKIQKGDQVWAWDEETGEVAIKEVVETYVNETDELVHVFVNGEEIVTTPAHPFYSPVKGWTEAAHLRAGDILVLVNGEYVVVEMVQHEILEAPVTVYNFQVEDYHTYYVADNGVLVHNSCAHKTKSWRAQKRDYWRAHQNDVSDLYDLTPDNVLRMSKGKAPIGIDGYPIELHHIDGIANSDAIRAMTKTTHTILHKFVGYGKMVPYSF